MGTLSERLKQRAAELGFQLSGICPAAAPPGAAELDEWLRAGFAGEMTYLEDRRDAYHDPSLVLAGARSILMLGMPYHTRDAQPAGPGQGRVSRYAWGDTDYHTLIRRRLHVLADELRSAKPGAATRCAVDTAPLLERDFARLAGLGWIGKNTLLINRPAGSYFFLAAVLTDAVLDFDSPVTSDHCGNCTACLDACPTDAFAAPYVLDARRCISYLTIESRRPAPVELRAGIGEWLFGCDVCQDVCPWNRKPGAGGEPAFDPIEGMNPVELAGLFSLDEEAFRRRFRHTPLWRAHREGLLRNAAIVLGNRPAAAAADALLKGLVDPHPLVRGACAWALGRYTGAAARRGLRQRLADERDATVRQEIEQAIRRQASG
ncbi:MAG: tRNA epoxyqueuosine(34) reductase QueG [Planctomycetota bacterium]